MTVRELEETIVKRLREKFVEYGVDIAVAPYPENPSTHRLKAPHGEVFVRYNSSNFSEPSGIQQQQFFEFEITVLTRNLRTEKIGAYDVMAAVRRVLTEWLWDGFSRFYQVGEDYLSERNGQWEHGMKFITQSLYFLGE